MELNLGRVDTPPRPAATMVLLRDAPAPASERPLEVFLIKRHGLSDVLGGAYVFPGGKYDSADAALDPERLLDQAPEALHHQLAEPGLEEAMAAGLFVAAAREAFEECGLLLATRQSGEPADAAMATQARTLAREGHQFDEVLALLGLRLSTRSIRPWVRWITPTMPSVMNKRFDTRFFIAAAPAGQTAGHDNHEATASTWLTPRAALEQYRDGSIELAPPQIMSLAHLSRHATMAQALAEAAARRPPTVQPEPFDEDGTRVLTYPGDPRHSVRERAFPGPTRLRYHHKRFEPFGGFEDLFAD
jgi:8-oxo-dGTP pyrophosphatase MutT (NUDIX family)